MLGITLFFILFTLNLIGNSTQSVVVFGVISVIFLLIYFISESKTPIPIIQLTLFKKLSFIAPMFSMAAFGAGDDDYSYVTSSLFY